MSFALAVWRFRGRFRKRNFVHRSGYANGFRHLGQPVAVTICNMSGTDTVHSFSGWTNNVCPICRDSDADEYVADSGRQARKLSRRTFQAKCPHGKGSVYRCVEYDVGSEAAASGHDIEMASPFLSVSFVFDCYPDLLPGALWIEIDYGGCFSVVERFLPTN